MLSMYTNIEDEMSSDEIVSPSDDKRIPSMDIRLEKVPTIPGCLILHLKGWIHTYNAGSFLKRGKRAIDEGYTRLIVESSELDSIGECGIRSIISFLTAVRPRGGDLVIAQPKPRVREVFQLLGFGQFINMTETLNEAIEYFRKASKATKNGTFPRNSPVP
jgi:anti-sigma B factor antagonist